MADSPSELEFEIEKLERRHAEHPEGRFFVPLANAYRKMGDLETAEALLRNGVERHPDYLSAHIVLGRCLADRGAGREAEEEFRFVLAEDPQNLIALRTLGELASADGRQAEAAEWYRELLAVDPMNEDARQALEALSEAPVAPEPEAEFRSGAGWWESGTDVEGASPALAGQSEELPADPVADRARDDGNAVPQDGNSARAGYDELPTHASDSERAPSETSVGRGAESEREASAESGVPPGRQAGHEMDAPADTEPRGEGDDVPYETFARREAEPFSTGFVGDELGLEDDYGAGSSGGGSSEVVTETIAELYARQGLHERAAGVYRELIRRRGGDSALEQRLAELERLSREETASDSAEHSLKDREALQTSPADTEEDAFAASFAEGFTTISDEPEESDRPVIASEVTASPVSERGEGDSGLEPPGPLPSGAAADAHPSDVSIVGFLSELSRWRPASAPVATSTKEEQPSPPAGASAPDDPAAADDFAGDRGGHGVRASGRAETPGGAEAAGTPRASSGGPREGTVPAEDDEPFPWELPGAAPLRESAGAGKREPAELDPYFVDDVEPPLLAGEESLPLAAPTPEPEPRNQPQSGSESPRSDPTEDEDLESFQAWLRSLKR